MCRDGSLREHECLQDALVEAAFGHELKNLALTGGELTERVSLALARDEPRNDVRGR